MKRQVIMAWLIIMLAPEVHADDQWYDCKQDDQCIMVIGKCGFTWAANKDFADISRQALAPRVCNALPVFHPPGTTAKCVHGRCTLIPPGK